MKNTTPKTCYIKLLIGAGLLVWALIDCPSWAVRGVVGWWLIKEAFVFDEK